MAYDKYSVQHQILCSLMHGLYGGHRFLGMTLCKAQYGFCKGETTTDPIFIYTNSDRS